MRAGAAILVFMIKFDVSRALRCKFSAAIAGGL
jgi:hypothetical protein